MTSTRRPPRCALLLAARALDEDLTPLGDVSSALLPSDLRAGAVIAARGDGVLAGRACAAEVFAQVDPDITVAWSLDDGDLVAAGSTIGRVEGPLHSVLTAERNAPQLPRAPVGHRLAHGEVRGRGGAGARVGRLRKTCPPGCAPSRRPRCAPAGERTTGGTCLTGSS